MFAHQPADAAAEGQAADAGRGDHAAGGCQLVAFAFPVELSPLGSALRDGRVSAGVYLDAVHEGEVNHHGVVGHGLPGDAVAASADADGQLMFASEADGLHDVRDAGGPDDRGWLAVNHAVPYPASWIVFLMISGQNRAVKRSTKAG